MKKKALRGSQAGGDFGKPFHANSIFPSYHTYQEKGRTPSMLSQRYPRPVFREGEVYYPTNIELESYFSSYNKVTKFGAASFCGFLEDTVEVEHCVVIPSVVSLRRLGFDLPQSFEQDLYKTVTDEGFHAEQALQFAADLRSHFNLERSEHYRMPLFLRRLEAERSLEPNPAYRDLITVLNGVVTETRISVELSKFASYSFLADPVREICRTHAQDETIHGSQFRALGEWLWRGFDEVTKLAAARFITASTIARSLPDVDRIAFYLHQATGRSLDTSRGLVYSTYTVDVILEEMLIAARPTVAFLKHLGIEDYQPFEKALEGERRRLSEDLALKRRALFE